ncbi:MAG: A/G-specific adenine glycosylase, partial [Acidimicrobiales bacterium]
MEISDNREEALTRWSSRERRVLPWRATRDPWKILLSEVMLQQTQVERVVPKYDYFVASWPDIGDFAQAPLEKILNAWSGLGFPRRAVNLHRTARLVVTEYGSVIPKDLKTLLTLPGVGPYTARA